jgi:hypothetical protein
MLDGFRNYNSGLPVEMAKQTEKMANVRKMCIDVESLGNCFI